MNMKMTFFALAGKCGLRGASGFTSAAAPRPSRSMQLGQRDDADAPGAVLEEAAARLNFAKLLAIHGYSLVMNSSRFSITRLNSTQAAASVCGTPSRWLGNSAATAFSSCARLLSRLREISLHPLPLPPSGVAPERHQIRVVQPVAEASPPSRITRSASALRRFEEYRIVHQIERLQRRVGTLAARAGELGARARRNS